MIATLRTNPPPAILFRKNPISPPETPKQWGIFGRGVVSFFRFPLSGFFATWAAPGRFSGPPQNENSLIGLSPGVFSGSPFLPIPPFFPRFPEAGGGNWGGSLSGAPFSPDSPKQPDEIGGQVFSVPGLENAPHPAVNTPPLWKTAPRAPAGKAPSIPSGCFGESEKRGRRKADLSRPQLPPAASGNRDKGESGEGGNWEI